MAEECGETLDYDPVKVDAFLKGYEDRLHTANADGSLSAGERNIAFLETALESEAIKETLGDNGTEALNLQLKVQKSALTTPLAQQEVSLEEALSEAKHLLTSPDVSNKDCAIKR